MKAYEPLEQKHGEKAEQHPCADDGNLIMQMPLIPHSDDQGVRK